jgi:purine-nucleoside phosphorylase
VVDHEAIINPKRGKNSPELGPLAVIAATQPDLSLLCELFQFSERAFQPLFISRLYHDHTKTRKPDIALAGPFVGAPYAVMLVETLIAWGVTKILFLGWCGSVSETAEIGDIIVPTSALVDEGTSRHYQDRNAPVVFPSKSLLDAIKADLDRNRIRFHQGPIWTTDALYRETRKKVVQFQRLGAIGVEMEISALFTVAGFRGVEIGALVTVGDELTASQWRPGFKTKKFRHGCETACRVIGEICHAM